MSAAALSAVLGAALVVASHLVTLLVARATAGTQGPVAAPALAMTYVLKVFLLGGILLTVPAPPWLVPGWAAAGVLGALVVSLALAARAAGRGARTALGPLLEARRRAEAGAGAADDTPRDPHGHPHDRARPDRRQDDHEHG
ncbi:hypothetical protein QYM41_03415 [Kocuria sp. CPCC 205268]|uniref:hypothetical protein n=1 Tax=Kocuria oxytropis TaxID=3058913 RepID=UPI0034D4DE12